ISRPISGSSVICSGVMLVLTSVFVWSTRGAELVTSTVSLTAPGARVKFWVDVLPTSNSRFFVSAVENPGAVALSEYTPADNESNRYSPASLVLVVRVAPVSLLVSVTSALLPITACDLSVIVPSRLAFAVAWPNRLAVLSRTKQLMTAIHSHLLLFILISPWKLVVCSTFFLRVLSKMHLLKKLCLALQNSTAVTKPISPNPVPRWKSG